jgi:hypothetical protein
MPGLNAGATEDIMPIQSSRNALITVSDTRGQISLFPPGACPAATAAGQGRPAEGPIQTFFELLYTVRHGGVKLPEQITDEWLARNRFAAINPGRLSHTLRYLGLADAAGQPVLPLWRLNQQDPAALYLLLLENGYADLEHLLQRSPSWHTVLAWISDRSGASDQMCQRRFAFYRHLRLAAQTGHAVWERLKAAARDVDWDSLLPPPPAGAPSLRVILPVDPPSPQPRQASKRMDQTADPPNLVLPLQPVLDVIQGISNYQV